MAIDLSSSRSALSTLGLPIALVIGFGFVMLKPRRRARTRLGAALRYLLSRRIWLHPSSLLDYQFVIVGPLIMSLVSGYTMLTGLAVSFGVSEGLKEWFGPQEVPTELPWFVTVLIVLCLYLAFEFAYWLDHFLSHKLPFLWEFHKVHHSAKVLTPFANWRVHPVDTIVYANILAIVAGSVGGVIQYFVGEAFSFTCMAASSMVFAIYMTLWGHLQHSQLWISWSGLAGRIFLSPAHHQIHHSSNPIHFDKNFGAALALWDWVFRTLHLPKREHEHIRFGTHGDAHLKSLIPALLYPFHYAAKRLIAMLPRKAEAGSEGPGPMPVANPSAGNG